MSRLLSSSLLLAVFAGLLAPSAAVGSCGDWLQHSGQAESMQDDAENVDDAATRLPSAPRPCDGPNCKSAPQYPAPATPSFERTHLDAAVLREPGEDFGTLGSDHSTPYSFALPSGHARRIERPPQS